MRPKVWQWRRALAVSGRAGTPGSQKLIQASAEVGVEAMQEHIFTHAEWGLQGQTARSSRKRWEKTDSHVELKGKTYEHR